MQGGVAEQFMAELQRFQKIGVEIVALTEESSELRKRLMATYEDCFGKIADKQVGEFFVGDRLFTFSRDAVGKEINILFRTIPRLKLSQSTEGLIPEGMIHWGMETPLEDVIEAQQATTPDRPLTLPGDAIELQDNQIEQINKSITGEDQ